LALLFGHGFAGDNGGAVGAAFDGDFLDVEAEGCEFELHGGSPGSPFFGRELARCCNAAGFAVHSAGVLVLVGDRGVGDEPG